VTGVHEQQMVALFGLTGGIPNADAIERRALARPAPGAAAALGGRSACVPAAAAFRQELARR